MRINFKKRSFCCAYLLLMFFGYLGLGWLFAAYKVSSLVWLGTFVVILHLSFTGSGGIFLANIWLILMIALGIILCTQIKANFLNFNHAPIWAFTLLFVWFLSIILIVMLAFAAKPIKIIAFVSETNIKRNLILDDRNPDNANELNYFRKQMIWQLSNSLDKYILTIFTWIAMRIGLFIYSFK